MTKDDLIHDIALLSLSRANEEHKKAYLRKLAVEAGVNDEELAKLIEDGKRGHGIPDELMPDWNMLQGKLFEEFMASKLSTNHNFERWSNDKNVRGVIYDPTSKEPDLLYSTKGDNKFAVECKWHNKKGELVRVVKYSDQLNNYKKYQEETGFPVYMAIGYGKSGQDIDELYIVPLDFILEQKDNATNISIDKLKQYLVTNVSELEFVNGKLC